MVVVVVVVICTRCAGYGVCTNHSLQLFLSKRIIRGLNSLPVPQYGLYEYYLKRLE